MLHRAHRSPGREPVARRGARNIVVWVPPRNGNLLTGAKMAEVDGNRTRRTGIARPTRFEGGGAHQVPRHLHAR